MYPKIHFTFVETEINIFKEAGNQSSLTLSHSFAFIFTHVFFL